jgi:hypothetical protein
MTACQLFEPLDDSSSLCVNSYEGIITSNIEDYEIFSIFLIKLNRARE